MKSARFLACLAGAGLGLFLRLGPAIGGPGVMEPTAPTDIRTNTAAQFAGYAPGYAPGNAIILPPHGREVRIAHMPEVEDIVLELTNRARARKNLNPLKKEPILAETARAHGEDMIERNFFDHNNPDGQSPFDRIAIAHRRLIGTTGENLWLSKGVIERDPRELAGKIMALWMSSPGHRENILRPEFTHLGVGVCAAGNVINATQNFAEVRAYLLTDLPEEIRRGDSIDLRAAPFSPVQYDFQGKNRGMTVNGPFPISRNRVDIQPGVYQMRFYFMSKPNSYSIYTGPQLKVD